MVSRTEVVVFDKYTEGEGTAGDQQTSGQQMGQVIRTLVKVYL
jgi:hypothetical protein